MKILDSHVHLPSKNRAKVEEASNLGYFSSASEAIRYAKQAGIGGMVFTTMEGVWCDTEEELESANRETLELYETAPSYLYPGVEIHPSFPECSRRWLKTFLERGFVWVGELVHYRAGRGDYDRPEWLKLFRICCDEGMIVQLHESPSIQRLAKRLPELRIVCSHITLQELSALAAFPNVMVDFSGVQGGLKFGAMEEALKQFGAERVLFGTDFIVFQPEAFLFRTRQAFPDKSIFQKIVSENLRRILRERTGKKVFSDHPEFSRIK